MRRTLIRYKTKPEMADKNAELVAAVFAELKAAQPDGTRYLTLRLEDNTFIHFVESAAAVLIGILELMQLFVPGRHARLEDFVVDALTALAGFALATIIGWLTRSHWYERRVD